MKNSINNFLDFINYKSEDKNVILDNCEIDGYCNDKSLEITLIILNLIPIYYILNIVQLTKNKKLDSKVINLKFKLSYQPSLKTVLEVESLRDNKVYVFHSDNNIECSLSKKDKISEILKIYNKYYINFSSKDFLINELLDPKIIAERNYKYKQLLSESKKEELLVKRHQSNKYIVEELKPIKSLADIDYDNRFPSEVITEGLASIIIATEGKKKFFIKFKLINDIYSLICVIFLDLNQTKLFEEIKQFIKDSETIAVSGTLKYKDDNWDKGLMMNVYKMANSSGKTVITPKEVIIESEKDISRVEFSIHTKMSAMNGVSDVSEFIKTAIDRNYLALAITDINDVQSFPEAFNYLKNNNYKFKLIYGAALEMVDDFQITLDDVYDFLDCNDYIVYDLETTGLTANFHEIIEFGAFKISNGLIKEKIQFLIKPEIKLSKKITEITKITNELLEKDGISKEQAYKKIKEFIGDLPIIAHNGNNFDVKFLNTLFEKFQDKLKNISYDTLLITQVLNNVFKIKWFNLGSIAKYFGINYLSDTLAHRAIYDVEILYQVILKIKELVKDHNLNEVKLTYENFRGNWISLYAKNQKGIYDLYRLISDAHIKYFSKKPKILKSEIMKFRNNIFISNHEDTNEIIKAINYENDQEINKAFAFYDFISVLAPSCLKNLVWNEIYKDEKTLKYALNKIINTAIACKKKYIAVSNSYYLTKNDKILRKIFVNTKGLLGVRHYLYYNFKIFNDIPENHFFTSSELYQEFAFISDKEILDNLIVNHSIEMAKKFDEDVKPLPQGTYFAKLRDDANEIINKLVNQALENKYIYNGNLPEIIKDRIKKELDSIINNNFANIYLISQKIVKNSLDQGYLVGSRGSVGSSLVATLLEITEVNPLPAHYLCPNCHYSIFDVEKNIMSGYDLKPIECPKCNTMMKGEGHNIPFETFLGIEGNKVPDIDLNFASDFQNQAHNYVKKIFGENNVIRAGTISTVAKKTAFAFCKKYEEENNIVFTGQEINSICERIVGVKRTTGQHPGGIIIIPKQKSIYDFTPINFPADDTSSSWKTSHFAYESLHDNLLKLDLLGHVDPQALSELYNLTKVNPKNISFFDRQVMSLFTSTDQLKFIYKDKISTMKNGAIGIPEFGTNFVRRILDETKPYSFANLVQISGLSHGTDVWAGNAANLIQREGKKLDEIICCRDDIMIYLMKNGMNLKDSFSITENVRKGKGLSKKEVEKLISYNIPQWYIDSCKKIKYMFPKAHATAYVIMAWRIAWYKINFPLEYYCVYFSTRCIVFNPELMVKDLKTIIEYRENLSGTKIAKEENLSLTLDSVIEMLSRGYKFQQITINQSHATKFIINPKTKEIIIPFSALDGLGETNAEEIIKVRDEKLYKDFDDFATRSGVNKTQLTNLKKIIEFN